MQRNLVVLHLSLIKGIGYSTIHKLVERVPDIINLYQATAYDIQQFGMSQKTATLLVEGLAHTKLLEDELMLIHKHNVTLLTIEDADYPSLLRTIYCPPVVLYCMGKPLAAHAKAVAFVGSRKADEYARAVIDAYVPPLVERSWSIVSGGALGADTLAHRATLQAQGSTVAVIGSGLLVPYPASNRQLFKRIAAEGGTMVSSFPLTETAHAGNFPARNRIIAGLSQATVVVQAAQQSGARITALFALEQGRNVMAVPGSIFNPLSHGCHRLIKEGAAALMSATDLLIELGEQVATEPDAAGQWVQPIQQMRTEIADEQIRIEGATIEDKIVLYCREQARSLDDLMQLLEEPLDVLQDVTFNLQLAGKLEQNLIGSYQAI